MIKQEVEWVGSMDREGKWATEGSLSIAVMISGEASRIEQ
jgi:hypothetical protein